MNSQLSLCFVERLRCGRGQRADVETSLRDDKEVTDLVDCKISVWLVSLVPPEVAACSAVVTGQVWYKWTYEKYGSQVFPHQTVEV